MCCCLTRNLRPASSPRHCSASGARGPSRANRERAPAPPAVSDASPMASPRAAESSPPRNLLRERKRALDAAPPLRRSCVSHAVRARAVPVRFSRPRDPPLPARASALLAVAALPHRSPARVPSPSLSPVPLASLLVAVRARAARLRAPRGARAGGGPSGLRLLILEDRPVEA